MCSPSNSPGIQSLANKRSSRLLSTLRTVGRKFTPLAPVGWTLTSSLAPFFISPLARRMNGFHCGKLAKSVRTCQTRSAEAFTSISLRSSFIPTISLFVPCRIYGSSSSQRVDAGMARVYCWNSFSEPIWERTPPGPNLFSTLDSQNLDRESYPAGGEGC